jgi:hypothetical protein
MSDDEDVKWLRDYGFTIALPLLYSYLDRFATAFLMLRLLYYCFTPTTGTTSGCATAKSLYYCFTTALLLLYSH